MKLIIEVDICLEESGLNENEVKDNIVDFTKDLLINGAENEEITLTLNQVSYEDKP